MSTPRPQRDVISTPQPPETGMRVMAGSGFIGHLGELPRAENACMLEAHAVWNSTASPIGDSLHSALVGVEPEQLANFGGATKGEDDFGVSVFAHDAIKHHVYRAGQHGVENDSSNCGNLRGMDPTLTRLEQGLKSAGVRFDGPSDVAALLEVSPQRINNWAERGVSKEGALKAQLDFGISATYILGGSLPILITGSQPTRLDPQMLAESIAALRQVSRSTGLPYDEVEHVDATVAALEIRSGMPEAPSQAQVIDFGQKVREILERRGS